MSELENKKILDVACGGRMFYYDKKDSKVLFCDNRYFCERIDKNLFEVKPDKLIDFTNLEFEDESFNLVVFDPPHIIHGSDNGILVKKYSKLSKDWEEVLQKGFNECYRVLKQNGTLVFKWSERQIALSEVLKCFNRKPLLMQKTGTFSHFIVFFKG